MNTFMATFVAQLALVPPAMYFVFFVWYCISIAIVFLYMRSWFRRQLIVIHKTIHEQYAKYYKGK